MQRLSIQSSAKRLPTPAVIRGLDPRTHLHKKRFAKKKMDHRVKPGEVKPGDDVSHRVGSGDDTWVSAKCFPHSPWPPAVLAV
jgi:hypothetical protein